MARVSNPGESITPLGNSVFRVTRSDGAQFIAYGVVDGTRTWVFVDGVTYVIEPARRMSTGTGHDASALAAPMPATVTQIHVAVGQVVAPGDPLVTLEAMKMELPIRALASGTVTAINCRVGELVQPGLARVDVRDREADPEHRTTGPDKARATNPETPNPEAPNPEAPNPEAPNPEATNREPPNAEEERGTEPEHELRSEKREE